MDSLLLKLVKLLKNNCSRPEIQKRYADYKTQLDQSWSLGTQPDYPLDSDGFAISYDPVTQEQEFYEAWKVFGFVVGKSIVSQNMCQDVVQRMTKMLSDLSDGQVSLDQPKTLEKLPRDEDGTPCISRGFFEIYHDDSLAKLRQSIRGYLQHVLIWGRADLWTTFDRFGIKLPEHPDALGLALHVDQNPLVHPDFKTVQGVLALVDCPIERGTYVAVPGSKNAFMNYGAVVNQKQPDYAGEYVEAFTDTDFGQSLQGQGQCIPLRAGDMVSWDSRTTHANSTNLSNKIRFVAYISAGIAAEENQELTQARIDGYTSGLGSNVRDALMHASMRPRYTDQDRINAIRQTEQLTVLGKLLYGQESYMNVP